MENLKQDVQRKFTEIRNALHMREKLLLRQADVILQQTTQQMGRGIPPTTTEIRQVNFLVEQEDELLSSIRNFGRFQLDNINLTLLQSEDYITPVNDHEIMYKCLQQGNVIYADASELDAHSKDDEQPEAIIVDFSRNKSLIEHNAKHMNESIINITLQEAKELIKKAKLKRDTPIPPLNLEELDDELESSIAEAVSSLGHETSDNTNTNYTAATPIESKANKSTKKPNNRFKPKITINNCNGTINLRNISNLTINCATEESISAEIPVQTQQEQQERAPQRKEPTSSERELVSSSSTIHNKKGNTCCGRSTVDSSENNGTIMEVADSSTDNSSTSTTTASSSNSNYSSNSSSRSQSKKQKTNSADKKSQSNTKTTQERTTTESVAFPYGMVDYEDDCENLEAHAVSCDFYNRLLKEIKNSLRTKRTIGNPYATTQCHDEETAADADADAAAVNELGTETETETCDPNSNTSSYISSVAPTSQSARSQQNGRRLVLKNFENLRIVLEANSSDEETFHPVQIEQWLAEIISETDLEPMQNTDILEHSKIHNETN